MNSVDVFEAIEAIAQTSARTRKDELLEALMQDSLGREVVRVACNPFITFGITAPKVKSERQECFQSEDADVWLLLHKLQNRDLTGNAALEAVTHRLKRLDPQSGELLRRIINKDLRAGFSKSSVNRVVPGTIPTFDVMLSKPFEEKRVKSWPVAVEPKLDGLRALGLVKEFQAKFFSRVGNHFPSLDHLSEPIVQMVENAIAHVQNPIEGMDEKLRKLYWTMLGGNAGSFSLAIDTEAVTGSFNKSMGDIRRGNEATDVVLNVFDAIPYAMMTGDDPRIPIPFKVRRAFAKFVVDHAPADAPIQMTPLRYANNVEEIHEIYKAHRKVGLEGAMVKLLDAPYEKKKGHLWMKMKAEETEDLRVIGWYEGKKDTKLEGKFGGFIVDRNGVQVNIGGGYSDSEREFNLEACRHDDKFGAAGGQKMVIGRLIEVEYHEVTPDGSLRHPRFVRFRDDKDEALKAA